MQPQPSHADLLETIDQAGVGIAHVSPDARWTLVNRHLALLLGYEREALIGRDSRDFAHPDDLPHLVELGQSLMAGSIPILEAEARFRHAQGHDVWMLVTVAVKRKRDGTPDHFIAIYQDITEKRGLAEERRFAEQRQRLHVQQTPLGAIEWNPAGEVVAWNPAAESIFGWTEAEALGRPWKLIVPREQHAHVEGVWRELFANRGGRRSSNVNVAKDGRLVECEWYNTPLVDASGVVIGVASLVEDVTARKRAQEERATIERKLRETQRLESLGLLAGGIAHDFSNLLTVILAHVAAARSAGRLAPQDAEHLEHAEGAALRAAELCKQMLDYAGRGHSMFVRLDLDQLVREMAELMRASIGRNTTLTFALAGNLPSVHGDPTQLRQVALNLVINAAEAIGDATGTITVRTGAARIGSGFGEGALIAPKLREGEFAFLEIEDTGAGIAAPDLARIFDPFFTTKFTGRGLGLAVVLGVARGHRGLVRVASTPGRGTRFSFLLPTEREALGARPAATPAARLGGVALVVDDHPAVRDAARSMLEHLDYRVLLAGDGREALERVRTRSPAVDVVLLDLTMPHLGGEATFRALRAIDAQMPVLLMSGYSEQDVVERFGVESRTAFLQKPFDLQMLRDKLIGLIGSS